MIFKQSRTTAVDFKVEIPMGDQGARRKEELDAAVLVNRALIMNCQSFDIAVINLENDIQGAFIISNFELGDRSVIWCFSHMIRQCFRFKIIPWPDCEVTMNGCIISDFLDE